MPPIRNLFATALMSMLSLTMLGVSPSLRSQTMTTAASPRTPAEAAAQHKRAARLRAAADEALVTEQAACYRKILVNSCLDDARQRHTQSIIEARELDGAAREFERETRRTEIETKTARRHADRAHRESKQSAKSEANRAKQAKRAAERERKIAERAVRAGDVAR